MLLRASQCPAPPSAIIFHCVYGASAFDVHSAVDVSLLLVLVQELLCCSLQRTPRSGAHLHDAL
eukprot:5061481-Pyramimonas_sp.AAC.1